MNSLECQRHCYSTTNQITMEQVIRSFQNKRIYMLTLHTRNEFTTTAATLHTESTQHGENYRLMHMEPPIMRQRRQHGAKTPQACINGHDGIFDKNKEQRTSDKRSTCRKRYPRNTPPIYESKIHSTDANELHAPSAV